MNDNIKQIVSNYLFNAFVKADVNISEYDYYKQYGHIHFAELTKQIAEAYEQIINFKKYQN